MALNSDNKSAHAVKYKSAENSLLILPQRYSYKFAYLSDCASPHHLMLILWYAMEMFLKVTKLYYDDAEST